MLSAEQNDLITRTGAGTPAGNLMRRYWQPAALVDELSGNRPVKPVRLFGEDLVIFKDEHGRYGLIGRRCIAALISPIMPRSGGLRCAFHGWLFDVHGKCLERQPGPTTTICATSNEILSG
jgi:phenylpropionate dioxygenase-like ring-hydroxylating dioxygenase large terminal subunit